MVGEWHADDADGADSRGSSWGGSDAVAIREGSWGDGEHILRVRGESRFAGRIFVPLSSFSNAKGVHRRGEQTAMGEKGIRSKSGADPQL